MVTATSLVVPVGRDLDPLAGEIDGVLDQIAETIEDRRIARADRLGGDRRRQRDLDGDAEIAVRRHHLLDQGGQLHAVERLAARRTAR